MFAISIETVDDTAICRVHGEADAASAPQLREALIGLTAHRKVIVDFSGVPFIDSAGLGCLIAGARRVHDVDGYIVLSSARRAVHRLLHTVGMDRVMPIVETMREAFDLLAEAQATPIGAVKAASTL